MTLHICTDHWTEGVPELVHRIAQEYKLHPPELFHPLIQIRDTAVKWLGRGVHMFNSDPCVTTRHLYLTKYCHALLVLHAGDLSSRLYKQNGGMLEPHPVTGPFGSAATYSWNVAFERRIPQLSINVLEETPGQAHLWLADVMSTFKPMVSTDPLCLAVAGPQEKFEMVAMVSWLKAFMAPLSTHADERHGQEFEYRDPLLFKMLDHMEKEVRRNEMWGEPPPPISPPPPLYPTPTIVPAQPMQHVPVIRSISQLVTGTVSPQMSNPMSSFEQPVMGTYSEPVAGVGKRKGVSSALSVPQNVSPAVPQKRTKGV